jgi:hypothetical protein
MHVGPLGFGKRLCGTAFFFFYRTANARCWHFTLLASHLRAYHKAWNQPAKNPATTALLRLLIKLQCRGTTNHQRGGGRKLKSGPSNQFRSGWEKEVRQFQRKALALASERSWALHDLTPDGALWAFVYWGVQQPQNGTPCGNHGRHGIKLYSCFALHFRGGFACNGRFVFHTHTQHIAHSKTQNLRAAVTEMKPPPGPGPGPGSRCQSPPFKFGSRGILYTYFYNHARPLRLGKLLYQGLSGGPTRVTDFF